MSLTSKVTLETLEAWGVYWIQSPNPAGTVAINYYACGHDLSTSNDTEVTSQEKVTGAMSGSRFTAKCTADHTIIKNALKIEFTSFEATTVTIRWWLVLHPVSWVVTATDGTLKVDVYIDKETETSIGGAVITTTHLQSNKKRMTLKVQRVPSRK